MKMSTLGYLISEDQILLLHRNKKKDDMHAGKWVGLGGKMEPGETPEECMLREFKEESGLVLEQVKWRGLITFPAFANEEDWYVYVFTASEYSGSLIQCEEGTLAWLPLDALDGLPTWEGDKIFLKWLLEDKRFFSGKIVYDQHGAVSHTVKFYE